MKHSTPKTSKNLRCSFCGIAEQETPKLLTEGGACICEECVKLAAEACQDVDRVAVAKSKRESISRKALAYLRRILKRNANLYTLMDDKLNARVLVIHRGKVEDISDAIVRFFPPDKVNTYRVEDLSEALFGTRWGLKRRKL